MDIKNKIIVITGGVNGMGFESTRLLLNEGAKFVAIFDLPESCGVRAIKRLDDEFGKGRAAFYSGDITVNEQFEENFKRVIEEHGAVDILINNAGIANEKNIQRLVDINVTAVLSCSLTAINHMGKHKGGKGGLIININAILGLTECPMLPFYCATKHAIIGFTRSMKDNFAATGVRVVSVCPGVTKTISLNQIPTNLLDFVSDKVIEKTLTEVPIQSPKSVALAIIEITKKGECGAVWVVENDQKPYAIKPSDHYFKMGTPIEKLIVKIQEEKGQSKTKNFVARSSALFNRTTELDACIQCVQTCPAAKDTFYRSDAFYSRRGGYMTAVPGFKESTLRPRG